MKDLLPGSRSVLFIFMAMCLACRQYFGNADALLALADQLGIHTLPLPFLKLLTAITTGEHATFYRLLIWVGGCVVFYLLLPMLFIRLFLKEPVRSFGFSGNLTFKDTRPYVYLWLMMPLTTISLVIMSDKNAKQKGVSTQGESKDYATDFTVLMHAPVHVDVHMILCSV